MKSHALGVTIFLLLGISGYVDAAPAVSLISGQPGGVAVRDSMHGWEFTAYKSIFVTHLGLFDDNDDGLRLDYPIGLFAVDPPQLLVSGTVHAGTEDTLIDRFRYVDTPDLRLHVGREYLIAYHTPAVGLPGVFDRMFAGGEDSEVSVASVINRYPHHFF